MLQITDEDFVGKYNLFKDNIVEAQGHMPLIHKVFEKGEIAHFTLEYDSARLDGIHVGRAVKRYLVVTIAPIRDIDGKITNAVVQHNDITSWKEANTELKAAYEQLAAAEEELRAQYDELRDNQQMIRESEEKFRALAENGPVAITVFQGSHNVYVNNYTVLMTGYSKEELYAMNYWDTIHPDFLKVLKERASARQQGGGIPQRYEMKYITKSGEVRWADLSAATITFQGKPAGISMFVDITERKRAEEELRAAYEQLKAADAACREKMGLLSQEEKTSSQTR
jgi:PAS domain S-box-containing protein